MKKFIAIIMVVAMLTAFVPAVFAVESEEVQSVDKSQFKTLETPTFYSTDNNGNKIASGTTGQAKAVTDFSDVNKNMLSVSANTKGFIDSPHYGVGLFSREDSLVMGYQFDGKEDFPVSDDFTNSGSLTHGMFFSPAACAPDDSGYITSTGFKQFKKGEKFWFNFDIIKNYINGGPTYYLDEDGNKLLVPFSIYMYSGTLSQWQSDAGLPLTACWQGLTRISTMIEVPDNNLIYNFFVAIDQQTLVDMGIVNNLFYGWLTISDYDKSYKEAKVQGTMEVGKQVTADIGGPSSECLLVYGDDVGCALAYGALFKVELKGGDRLALLAEGDGKIGGRVFFLDENKDLITSNYLGTGAVTGGDSYKALTWSIFPPIDGTYYILVSGFYYADEGEMQIELVDYETAQSDNSDMLPYFPDLSDVSIDLDSFGTEDVIETVEGIDVWGYFWEQSLGMGILVLAYPGTYHVTGEKSDMMVDMYDAVVLDLNNAKVATVLCNGSWAPCTINSTGSSAIIDNFYGAALLNYDAYYSGIYLTGDELEIAGEKGNGALLQAPVHVLTKKLTASATTAPGSYTVAFWTTAWNTPKLTWGEGVTLKDESGSNLKQTSLYFDAKNKYLDGYSVSPYDTLQRYLGSTDYYYIAPYFVATTKGIDVGPDAFYGDANLDNQINTGDAVLILRHVAGLTVLSGQAAVNADANRDGGINTGDAVKVLRHVAGLEVIPQD